MKTLFIYLGGSGPQSVPIFDGETIATIVADSGLELADKHGVTVDVIIGDMDSVDPALLKKYAEQGVVIEQFPRDKDLTDFELAIEAAKRWDADNLVIIGGGGGRLDHLLANIAIASGERTSQWTVNLITDNEYIYICRPKQPRKISGKMGEAISLIPIGANAVGVTTKGLKWELTDSTLDVHAARGVSNVCTEENVSVKISFGSLVAITSYIE